MPTTINVSRTNLSNSDRMRRAIRSQMIFSGLAIVGCLTIAGLQIDNLRKSNAIFRDVQFNITTAMPQCDPQEIINPKLFSYFSDEAKQRLIESANRKQCFGLVI